MDQSPELVPEKAALLAASRALLTRIHGFFRAIEESARARHTLRSATYHVELAVLSLGATDQGASQRSRSGTSKALTTFANRLMKEPVDGRAAEALASRLSSGGQVGLSGNSSVISLPEVLGMLQVHEKSGSLRVVTKTETLSMAFEKGDLVHAYSDNSPPGLRLGEILVDQGILDQAALDAFLGRHSADQKKLGEALEREELVTKRELSDAIEFQVQQLFLRAQESDAFYTFTPGEPEALGYPVRFGVVRLLLESARLQDEANLANPLDRITPVG